MNDQEQQQGCALRALTLCDGHSAASSSLHGRPVECYCSLIGWLETAGRYELASTMRTERARVVARSAEQQRIRDQRQKWLDSGF